jgi:hypothetical protein
MANEQMRVMAFTIEAQDDADGVVEFETLEDMTIVGVSLCAEAFTGGAHGWEQRGCAHRCRQFGGDRRQPDGWLVTDSRLHGCDLLPGRRSRVELDGLPSLGRVGAAGQGCPHPLDRRCYGDPQGDRQGL